jgi:D12 class N6 adenine-specific DNA methyltransferase
MVVLRPFFSYLGSKWRIAPRYPAPECDMIVEPFAGSAGYSLRYPERKIYLSDTNKEIIAIWQFLIKATERDIASLPDLREGEIIDDYRIPQEAKWLMGFWIRQGAEYPAYRSTKFGSVSHSTGENLCAVYKRRTINQVDYIRHWKVKEIDYRELNNSRATWFIDPPYQVQGFRYVHNNIDYRFLGEWCRERKGQAIVCEGDGADWLPFRVLRRVNGSSQNGKASRFNEVVWFK